MWAAEKTKPAVTTAVGRKDLPSTRHENYAVWELTPVLVGRPVSGTGGCGQHSRESRSSVRRYNSAAGHSCIEPVEKQATG